LLSSVLKGDIERRTITQIYGPPGVGKTNLCIIASINYIKKGYKVVYIDTEGGLSIERVKQLSENVNGVNLTKKVLENLIIYEPDSFENQYKVIERLMNVEKLGLVVVDGISSLYRLELSDNINENAKLNRLLGKQILTLLNLSKKKNVGVIITNQVSDTSYGFKATGGKLLEYWSKTIFRVEKIGKVRKLILEKHRHCPEGLEVKFKILKNELKEIS